MKILEGTGTSGGIAVGRARLLAAPSAVEEEIPGKGAREEARRCREAADAVRRELRGLRERAVEAAGEAEAQIFEIHALLLDDPDFTGEIQRQLDGGAAAETAVRRAGEALAAEFEALGDPNIRERAADIRDVSRRLLSALGGGGGLSGEGEPDGPVVLVADELTPSDTLSLDRSQVAGFVTRRGSAASHVSILARAMGIPAVVGIAAAPELEGRLLAVDGDAGRVTVDPDEAALSEARSRRRAAARRLGRLRAGGFPPAETRGGIRVELAGTSGAPGEARVVLENGGEAVGLFRSEFLYLGRETPPDEETQYLAYREALERMEGRRVIVRTVDIGSDKRAPCLDTGREENPALGWRAIRICLDRRELFRTQLRALLRASVHGRLAVMFPMIASLQELRCARKLLGEARAELETEGTETASVEVGVMIETPAAAVLSDLLAREADFFSIGTNDLTQYTLAADRMNERIAGYYRPADPAVLRLMKLTAENARKNGVWTGVCGESAADPALIPLYLAMGITELSMSPAALPEARERVRSLDMEEARATLARALGEVE